MALPAAARSAIKHTARRANRITPHTHAHSSATHRFNAGTEIGAIELLRQLHAAMIHAHRVRALRLRSGLSVVGGHRRRTRFGMR